MITYHSDTDDKDLVNYLIYQRDNFLLKSELIAESDEQVDIMAILFDNLDTEKQGHYYRYEYDVVKVVGVKEREVSRTTYSVLEIEQFPRDEM